MDAKIDQKSKDICFFNSLNAAIQVVKDRDGTDEQIRKYIVDWRNWFYEEWVRWRVMADLRAKNATLCPYKECPECKSNVKYIPAGVSKKSGKPYDEFWGCSNKECKWTYSPKDAEQAQKSEAEDRAMNEHTIDEYYKECHKNN